MSDRTSSPGSRLRGGREHVLADVLDFDLDARSAAARPPAAMYRARLRREPLRSQGGSDAPPRTLLLGPLAERYTSRCRAGYVATVPTARTTSTNSSTTGAGADSPPATSNARGSWPA